MYLETDYIIEFTVKTWWEDDEENPAAAAAEKLQRKLRQQIWIYGEYSP